MSTYSTYTSRETVKARKVTDKDGETVVTSLGPIHANKGDYIVLANNGESDEFRVMNAENFAAQYKGKGSKGTAKGATKSAAKPPAKAAESAVERVRARAAAAKK